ncbi:MAG: hypothetical protein CSA62_07005 [Planctomycetota bacterium]|nr:MAG: hypothetical protein CSA62_07005 [Planctomycetota bacterium]
MRTSIFAATALLAVAATAQSSVIVPKSVGTKEGNANVWTPVRYNPSHTQWHVAASEIGLRSAVWSQMAMRRDGPRSTPFVAKTIEVEIWMNNSAKKPGRLSYRFSENLKGGTRVLKRKKVNLTAPKKPTSGAAPFTEVFKFDTKFAYTGMTLVVDMETFHAKEIGYWYADAQSYKVTQGKGPDSGAASVGTVKCPKNFYQSRAGANWPGGAIAYYGYSRVKANSEKVGFFAIGRSRSAWGSLKLPYSLSKVGGVGCEIATSFDVALPIKTDKTRTDGYVYLELDIPNDPNLAGVQVHSQMFVSDKSFNALGWRVSRRYTNQIGKNGYLEDRPGLMLYNYYTLPSYDVGIYRRDVLPIVEFK